MQLKARVRYKYVWYLVTVEYEYAETYKSAKCSYCQERVFDRFKIKVIKIYNEKTQIEWDPRHKELPHLNSHVQRKLFHRKVVCQNPKCREAHEKILMKKVNAKSGLQ